MIARLFAFAALLHFCACAYSQSSLLDKSIQVQKEAQESSPAGPVSDTVIIDRASEIARRQGAGSSTDRPRAVAQPNERSSKPSPAPLSFNTNTLHQLHLSNSDSQAIPEGSDCDLPDDFEGDAIFVSQSMSQAALRAALEEASATKATVFIRGVLPGDSFTSITERILLPLAKDLKPAPNFLLDPRPFKQFSVTTVPTVVASHQGRFVLIPGTASVEYAERRFAAGASGRQPAMGRSLAIAEPDLIDEMRRRAAAVDWAKKKEEAYARYWRGAEFVQLPTATEDRVWSFDPSVVVPDDIVAPGGAVIAHAGDTYNPLSGVSFQKTIVVFNATDSEQLAFARRIADEAFSHYRPVILITTEVDRDKGWDAFDSYQSALGPYALFLLDKSLQDRFNFKAVPSVVDQMGDKLQIHEVKLHD